MRLLSRLLALASLMLISFALVQAAVPDTGQIYCYDVTGTSTPCPQPGEALFGQDANYQGVPPAFQDNGDGTTTDLNTGLMWQQDPGTKMDWDQAMANAASINTGGYTDWRVPTIKELYSLIDFSGYTGMDAESSIPYIDENYFLFFYGDESAGERVIDAQYWSSTEYVSTTMNGAPTVFGVNFADGRIKGYPKQAAGGQAGRYVRYVRGGDGTYGINNFADNGNSTVTDQSTGLVWAQDDSGVSGLGGLNWSDALLYCETLTLAEADDWRLPDAKELQYIVDYTRSPATTSSPAIDPIFNSTTITDEGGNLNYPFYWTSTTHLDGGNPGDHAVYIAFGEALGFIDMQNSGEPILMDVHGAGAQRSDLKEGDPYQYPTGFGPQGDVIRIYNYARCVRGGNMTLFTGGSADPNVYNSQPRAGQEGGLPAGQEGGQPQGQGGAGQPDLDAAAAQLGITVQELQAALGPPPPDFEAAAATLGITVEELMNALGLPAGGPGGQGPGGQQPGG